MYVKAYADETISESEILFNDSLIIPVFNNWQDIDIELLKSCLNGFPNYFLRDNFSLIKTKKENGRNWEIIGGRVELDSLIRPMSVQLSFKFTRNEYGRVLSSFVKADSVDLSDSLSIKRLSKISIQNPEIATIQYSYPNTSFLLINDLLSDLYILDIGSLWKKLLSKN